MGSFVPNQRTQLRKDDVKRRACSLPSRIGPSLPLDAHRCWFKVKSTTLVNVRSYIQATKGRVMPTVNYREAHRTPSSEPFSIASRGKEVL